MNQFIFFDLIESILNDLFINLFIIIFVFVHLFEVFVILVLS